MHPTSRQVCAVCGGKLEQPGPRVCYGCYLDGLVPGEYSFLENYAFDEVWGHQNATARPGTGVQVLDLARPPRISDTWLKASILKHLGEIEARMGLEDVSDNEVLGHENGPVVYRGASDGAESGAYAT